MKTINKATLLVGLLFMPMLFISMPMFEAEGLPLSFRDNSLTSLSVTTNVDVIKPGSVLTTTVAGKLSINTSAVYTVTFYADTATQTSLLIGSASLFLPTNYGIGTLSGYAILIPTNAINNSYITVSISNGTTAFTKIPICIVQNPTYSELSGSLTTLQSTYTALQATYTALQHSYSQLQSNYNSLLANYNSLQTIYRNLQTTYNTLEATYTSLQANLTALTTLYNSLLANHTDLQENFNNTQTERNLLLTQVSSLSDNNTALNSQLNTLQAQAANLTVTNNAMKLELKSIQDSNALLQAQLAESLSNSDAQLSVLQANNTELQKQLTALLAEKTVLLTQTTNLENRINLLQLNNTNLQSKVRNLTNETLSLQAQLDQTQTQKVDLQSKNGMTTLVMYVTTFVATALIVVTCYVVFFVMKKKGPGKEAPLY